MFETTTQTSCLPSSMIDHTMRRIHLGYRFQIQISKTIAAILEVDIQRLNFGSK